MRRLFLRMLMLPLLGTASGCASKEDREHWRFVEAVHKELDAADLLLMKQQYSDAESALKNIELRIAPTSRTTGARYEIYREQGRYDEAIQVASLLARINAAGDRAISRTQSSCFIGELYLAQGKEDLARLQFEAVLVPENEEEAAQSGRLAFVFGNYGKYYLQTGESEKAKESFQKLLDYYIRDSPESGQWHGKTRMWVAIAKYYIGDLDDAEQLLLNVTGQVPGGAVVWHDDYAVAMTTLGRIHEHQGLIGQALKDFQASLIGLRNENVGEKTRTNQSDALSALAGFLLRHGRLDEAQAAYLEAKALREATTTATHPNYADILKGLADIAASRGEFADGTNSATLAMAVLDNSVTPDHRRRAPVLLSLFSLQTLLGQKDAAEATGKKLMEVRRRPLTVWDEDYKHTQAFYQTLLRRGGKQSEAVALGNL